MLSLRISKHWNRDPNWFASLDSELQSSLIAEYILTNETTKQKEEREKRQQSKKIDRMRADWRAKHGK